MPALYVALFQPEEGNVKHWALWLEHIGIYQVVGTSMEFELNIRPHLHPEDIDGHLQSIYVADVDDIAGFTQIFQNTEVSNDVVMWNCQVFVLDVLEALTADGIIDDYEYQEAKTELEGLLYD